MRYKALFLVSLTIALVLFLPGGTSTVSAHGNYNSCQWHYVRRGETLSSIGRGYGVSWRVLAQVNGLGNPNHILAGKYLCIPAGYSSYRSPMYGNQQYGNHQYGNHQYGNQQHGYPTPNPQPPPATPPSSNTVVVQVRNFEFVPKTVTIHRGDTVVWMRAEGFHNVHADDGSFGNQPSSSWTNFSHTFTTSGTVPYYCQIHGGPGGAGMSGVVIVQ